MKYDTIPTTNGVKRSSRFEISLSVFNFLAQKTMIAIGRTDAKTSEINSNPMNLDKLNVPFSNDKIRQIIKNRGMHMIGGLVIVDTVF